MLIPVFSSSVQFKCSLTERCCDSVIASIMYGISGIYHRVMVIIDRHTAFKPDVC